VSTNAIAEMMDTKASSVTDMLKKLAEKRFGELYKISWSFLTERGKLAAKMIVRKHRLWKFSWWKIRFSWDEVHEIAEQ
jgi:DtxR family Mn-dependent transcriptional regulator